MCDRYLNNITNKIFTRTAALGDVDQRPAERRPAVTSSTEPEVLSIDFTDSCLQAYPVFSAYPSAFTSVYTNVILITTKLIYPMTFRSLSETFVRRSCSILLPVLATVVM